MDKHPEIEVVTSKLHEDERGWFSEFYNETRMSSLFPGGIKQISVSCSDLNVLRGLHIQPGMDKMMRVLSGAILLVLVDMNPASKRYLRSYAYSLTGQHPNVGIFAPSYFARGFYALTDATVVEYYQSETFNENISFTIAWNDPVLNITWPSSHPTLSGQDKNGMSVQEYERWVLTESHE